MKSRILTILAVLSFTLFAEDNPETKFFIQESAAGTKRVSFTIEGDRVSGTQVWQPKGQAHGSTGSLVGTIDDKGIIRVVHEFTIEGSTVTAEEMFKFDGTQLFIGEGELEDKNGRLNFKDPAKVVFKKAMKKADVFEPKPGSPQRKAIMDAMRAPVTKRAGKPVKFTGSVFVSNEWACFQGNVRTEDGEPPKNDDVAAEMELDFFALLRKDGEGGWKLLHSGFAGDIGVKEEAREKFPKAPWALFP